jgi:hypothetical protein
MQAGHRQSNSPAPPLSGTPRRYDAVWGAAHDADCLVACRGGPHARRRESASAGSTSECSGGGSACTSGLPDCAAGAGAGAADLLHAHSQILALASTHFRAALAPLPPPAPGAPRFALTLDAPAAAVAAALDLAYPMAGAPGDVPSWVSLLTRGPHRPGQPGRGSFIAESA